MYQMMRIKHLLKSGSVDYQEEEVEDTKTGKIYQTDGKTWKEVK